MSDDGKDTTLASLFAQLPDGPADDSFMQAVSTRIRRYRFWRGMFSSVVALTCGVIAAAILAPLMARMIVSGDLVLPLALFLCSLAALGITLIRGES